MIQRGKTIYSNESTAETRSGTSPFDQAAQSEPDLVFIDDNESPHGTPPNPVQKLNALLRQSERILLRIKAIFPFNFFMATLKIANRYDAKNPLTIEYLPKNAALQARRLIQGLMIAKKEGLDLSTINVETIAHKVEELGRAREPTFV